MSGYDLVNFCSKRSNYIGYIGQPVCLAARNERHKKSLIKPLVPPSISLPNHDMDEICRGFHFFLLTQCVRHVLHPTYVGLSSVDIPPSMNERPISRRVSSVPITFMDERDPWIAR